MEFYQLNKKENSDNANALVCFITKLERIRNEPKAKIKIVGEGGKILAEDCRNHFKNFRLLFLILFKRKSLKLKESLEIEPEREFKRT